MAGRVSSRQALNIVPDIMKLHDTYMRLKGILGDHAESLASVQLVEAYRRFWRPEKIRIILLAESHVYTSDDDRSIGIPTLPHLPGYPTQYARFVYCLGYGEKMLTNSHIHPKRDGTPQFWKIFYSCNNQVSNLRDFRPILSQTEYEKRIFNKIQLLQNLKAKGIWLIDASVVALYKNGKKTPHMFSALETSWKLYTRDIVRSATPDHVICIGKGVASIVEGDLKTNFGDNYTVIQQPNAFLSSEDHMTNYRKYGKICSS